MANRPTNTICKPLIVMIGIEVYDGLPNLAGVSKDYDNVLRTFVNTWQYKVLYKLNNNNTVYPSNSFDLSQRNYKLKWDIDEIESFVEEARKYIIKRKHDGLTFAKSSHGDTNKTLYDSACEMYELGCIYSMFSPEANQFVSSYEETEQESNHYLKFQKYSYWICVIFDR